VTGGLPSIAGVDFAVLADWMDEQGLPAGGIERVEELTGGSQNILVRFERGGRAYVLRRPPIHKRSNSDETMRREARVLRALTGTHVPHPDLIAACADESLLGGAFYLMEPIDGFNAAAGLPTLHRERPDLRHRMGIAMVEAAARLGAVDWRAVGLEGFGRPEGYLERQVGRWWSQLEGYARLEGYPGPAIPGAEDVARWLEANRPVDWTPGILHGDYHIANVLFEPASGEIAAIIDWELSTIGDPLLDLGWLLATWPDPEGGGAGSVGVDPWDGFATRDELVAAYEGAAGRRVAPVVDWYLVLACYKLGILLEGTHARACAGQAPKAIGDMLHAQTLELFERATSRIADR
jgi:aminoglycoside phosphotransferase (APT) family kinase protein